MPRVPATPETRGRSEAGTVPRSRRRLLQRETEPPEARSGHLEDGEPADEGEHSALGDRGGVVGGTSGARSIRIPFNVSSTQSGNRSASQALPPMLPAVMMSSTANAATPTTPP